MSKYNFEQNRSDYETPPELIQMGLRMARTFTGYACDVCCSRENVTAYHHFINGEKDGLKENWYSLNWCNPPFNECAKWIKKAYNEQKKGKETIMLIPVRTETLYFQKYIINNEKIDMNKDIIFFKKGIRFINPENNERMGIFKNALCLVYFHK